MRRFLRVCRIGEWEGGKWNSKGDEPGMGYHFYSSLEQEDSFGLYCV